MNNGVDVHLSPIEQQVIITALRHVPYGKCNFSMKDELISKIKGKPVSKWYLRKINPKRENESEL